MSDAVQGTVRVMCYIGGGLLGLSLLTMLMYFFALAWDKTSRKVRGVYQDELLRSILKRNRAEFLEWLQERGGQTTPRDNSSPGENAELDKLKEKLEGQLQRSEGYIAQYTVSLEKEKERTMLSGYWKGKYDAYMEQMVWLKEVLKDGE